ncbi:hypothetical protein I540_2588 [Mycobacteroides abscessus subsp. bolletii 1513]|uniref:Uncharacterized protein n=1 Tax=Mycobacteroides abscessus subsp. bolletii 1513 TaxID=1299321 RepID=X8DP50_9MYCO|nr:hypothetical protein I540_2588 [Mycobacteroides abscessus subsp. bolletii 1513]
MGVVGEHEVGGALSGPVYVWIPGPMCGDSVAAQAIPVCSAAMDRRLPASLSPVGAGEDIWLGLGAGIRKEGRAR